MKAEALLSRASRADARGDRTRAAREPLPLHRLREGHRRRSSSSRGTVRRRAAARDRAGRVGAGAPATRVRGARARRPRVRRRPGRDGMLHGALRFSDHPRAARACGIDASRALAASRASWRSSRRPTCRASGPSGLDRRATGRSLVAVGEDDRATSVTSSPPSRRRRGTRRARGRRPHRGRVRGARRRSRPVRRPRAGRPAPPGGNLLATSVVHRGDVDAALAAPPTSSGATFQTQRIEHAFLEPESCARGAGAGSAACTSSRRGRASGTTGARSRAYLGLPEERVRVTQVAAGGALRRRRRTSACRRTRRSSRCVTGRPVRLTLARAESLRFHPKRHPMWRRLHRRLRRRGPSRRRPGPHRRRHRRLRERRREGARARGRARLRRRTRSRTSTSRRRAVYTNNPPVRRDARLRRQPDELRDRRRARPARRAGGDRRLGDPLAQRARRPATGSGPARCSGPGVGLKKTLLAVRDAYRGARYAGHRLRGQEHGHRERRWSSTAGRSCAPEADGTRDALPLLDRDGPGRAHGLRADRVRGARPRPGRSACSSTPSATSTPARRRRRARPSSAGNAVIDAAREAEGRRSSRPAADRARRAGVPRRVRRATGRRSNDADEPVTHLAYAGGPRS